MTEYDDELKMYELRRRAHAWQNLQDKIAAWSIPTFPQQSVESKIEHLRRELDELAESPTDVGEFADCFMLLMDTARIAGFSMNEILEATECKLWVNMQRKWGPPDEHGVCEHIENEDVEISNQ